MTDNLKRTWAEISFDALGRNYNTIRGIINKECLLMAVVKADAYGHGAVPVARYLEGAGADYFGVSNFDEAIQLRQAGIRAPILILGYTPPKFTAELIENGLTQTVYDLKNAKEFSDAARLAGGILKIHIKVDTGMSRLGFLYNGAEDCGLKDIVEAAGLSNLKPEGIFTHFANADKKEDGFTSRQLELFLESLNKLEKLGVKFKIRHCANSGAVLNYKESHLDMVRPGLILYGLLPDDAMHGAMDLSPALSLYSTVSQIKDIRADAPVSYGGTYITKADTKIAVIPIGYADGYSRALSNRGEIIVDGQKAGLIGNICMDMCIADVSHIENIDCGDIVTIIGGGRGGISAEDLAELTDTISYEIICAISKRVLRLYFSDGKEEGHINYIR